MGWKQRFAAGAMSVACSSLLVVTVASAKIQRFTDRQGVVHITNQGETDQNPDSPETQSVPRPTFQGPEHKLEKMRALGIIPRDEKPVESSSYPKNEP